MTGLLIGPLLPHPNFAQNLGDLLKGDGIMFTRNSGQIIDVKKQLHPEILFKGQGKGADIYLRKTGITYVVSNAGEIEKKVDKKLGEIKRIEHLNKAEEQIRRTDLLKMEKQDLNRIDVDFENANSNPGIELPAPLKTYFNYYYPHCPQGITHVNAFNEVKVSNLYAGIDVRYYGSKTQGLEYDILVNPVANPGEIKLKYSGAEKMTLEKGKLRIETSLGALGEYMPKVYQNIDGKIVDVKAEYVLRKLANEPISQPLVGQDQLANSAYEVTFKLGTYNPELPLIIDPSYWATYYGGVNDLAVAIAVDNADNSAITGATFTNDLPNTAGHLAYGGSKDAFIAEIDPTGATCLWATYLGGSDQEIGLAITTDANKNVAVTGYTQSANFPLLHAAQSVFGGAGGNQHAFISEFSSAGVELWSTFYGGTSYDWGQGITADAAGTVYVTGYTSSTDIPVSAGAFQANMGAGANENAFVCKHSATGAFLQGTYYGGSVKEYGYGIAVDPIDNSVSITGFSESANLPKAGNAFGGGGSDAYVARFDNALANIVWAYYYGTANSETGVAIAIDKSRNVIMEGGPTFGAAGVPFFIVKYNSAGTLLWANNIPSSAQFEQAPFTSMDIDKQTGNIFVINDAEAPATPPVSACDGYHSKYNPGDTNALGSEDQYVQKFDSSGNYLCSTYIGGNGEDDHGTSTGEYTTKNMSVNDGRIYVTGSSTGQFPVTAGAFRTVGPEKHGDEAFVIRICTFACGDTNVVINFKPTIVNSTCSGTVNFSSSFYICDSSQNSETTYSWTFAGGNPASSSVHNPYGILYPSTGTYPVTLTIQSPCGTYKASQNLSLTITPCGCTLVAAPGVVDSVSCNGGNDGSATVLISGGLPGDTYTYSWSTGLTGTTTATTISLTDLTANTYNVLVKDGTCSASASVVIGQPTPITTTFTQVNPTCGESNGSVTVNASGGEKGYKYTWSNGQSGSSSITALPMGIYTVTITDSKGCSVVSTSTLFDNPPPTIVITPKQVTCTGTSTGALTALATGAGAVTYSWSTTASVPGITGLPAGGYTVTVTYGNGCQAWDTITLIDPPLLTITSINTSPADCNTSDGTVTVSSSGGTGNLTYNWSNGGTASTGADFSAGIFTVTVTDANGCVVTSTTNIGTNGGVTLTPNSTNPLCNGGVGIAGVTISSGAGNTPYTYSWSTAAKVVTNATSNTINNVTEGNYVVTVTDGTGCSTVSEVTITQPQALNVVISKMNVNCNHQGSAAATLLGGTPGYTYSWSCDSIAKTNSLVDSITLLAAGNYTLTVTDGNGCTLVNSTFVGAAGAGVLTANSTPSTISPGDSAFITTSGGISGWSWFPAGALACSTCQNSKAAPAVTTTYTIVAIDNQSCSDTVLITVTVQPLIPCESSSIFIPSAFSPNNDGKNDVLYVRGPDCITDFKFTIFDRWGEEVFETTSIANGWNGNYNGKPLNGGVYICYLKVTLSSGEIVERKGNLTLLK